MVTAYDELLPLFFLKLYRDYCTTCYWLFLFLVYLAACHCEMFLPLYLCIQQCSCPQSRDDIRLSTSSLSRFVSPQGIPEFWLTVCKNVDLLAEMIQEHDEPILKHLADIRVKFGESDPEVRAGTRLEMPASG